MMGNGGNGLEYLEQSIFDGNSSWVHHAFLDPDWEMYVLAYKTAADSLVDQAPEIGPDLVVYPAMFLYRHYLEIRLKAVLITFRKCAGLPVESYTKHGLPKLWKEVRPFLEQQWNSDTDAKYYDNVQFRIDEFHRIDEGSYSFRYPVTTKNESSLEGFPSVDISGRTQINLLQVHRIVSGISAVLDSANDMMETYYQDILSEYWAELRQAFDDSEFAG